MAMSTNKYLTRSKIFPTICESFGIPVERLGLCNVLVGGVPISPVVVRTLNFASCCTHVKVLPLTMHSQVKVKFSGKILDRHFSYQSL